LAKEFRVSITKAALPGGYPLLTSGIGAYSKTSFLWPRFPVLVWHPVVLFLLRIRNKFVIIILIPCSVPGLGSDSRKEVCLYLVDPGHFYICHLVLQSY
jgi:hypothetical protein